MNNIVVDRLARALLYEGYVLYPYRPSVKNSQRWTFGGVYPRAWSEAQTGADSNVMQTECLVSGSEKTKLRIIARFLHLTDRRIGELVNPLDELPSIGEPDFRPVQFLQIGGETYQSWQEAEEREVDLGEFVVADLLTGSHQKHFKFDDRQTTDPVRAEGGKIIGLIIRQQQRIKGSIELTALRISDGLFKLTVRIVNETELSDVSNRDLALMHSLISTHTILGVDFGEFVSLTDPPDIWAYLARQCRNIGTWPVLVGDGKQRDTMLSSPIILSDYPELAPESPGELFDSTEIDEILTLRIMTLTDEEKCAASSTDQRVRDLLSRTDAMARDQLMSLHGTMRGLRPISQEQNR